MRLPPQARLIRRFVLVLGGTAVVVVTLSLGAPIGERSLGLTFCYPFIGAVQRFNPRLPESLLSRVRAHEQAHADQCRRDGALWNTVRRLIPGQRLLTEAEGYCAEARFGIANGGKARLVYAEALDELRERRWFRRFSWAALADALASQCPAIAVKAAQEETEWQAWLHARRARRVPPRV